MQLVEQEKVRLEDPIQKYVPSFPEKGAPITLKHLMTHTSGIRHYRPTDFPGTEDNENMKPYKSIEEAITIFKDDPLLFAPGRYYSYSSYAVNLLQGVVEKAGGMPFEDYLRKFVWDAAGLRATRFDIPDRIVPRRAAQLRPWKKASRRT
jgi:CubicO group peptidase (beta-lactamase class C family)